MGLLVKSEKLQSSSENKKTTRTTMIKSSGIASSNQKSSRENSTTISSRVSSAAAPSYTSPSNAHSTSISPSPTKSYDDSEYNRDRSMRRNISQDRSYADSTTPTKSAVSLKSRIRAARKVGLNGDVHDLQFLIEEGPLSFRSFGFVGGFFMILASSLDFIEDLQNGDFTPMAKLVTFYLWFCGIIVIQLEGRPFHMQIPPFYSILIHLLNFLRFVWGRGFFYFFSGCLQFFLFSKYNMVSGVYFMLLGVFSIVFGYRASVKLAGLRNSISNKGEIKFLFHSFDRDRDGYLNHEEFREMLMSLDHTLDYNDFVAAMSAVDIENNQRVTYEDLEIWWDGYAKSDLPPGVACCGPMPISRYGSNVSGATNHLMT